MTDPKITHHVPPAQETALEPGQFPAEIAPPSRSHQIMRDIAGGSAVISFLAIVLALVISGILIALTDEKVQEASGYFFSRPTDTLAAIWDSVSGAYSALFQGSIYNFKRPGFARWHPSAHRDAHLRDAAHRGRSRCSAPASIRCGSGSIRTSCRRAT